MNTQTLKKVFETIFPPFYERVADSWSAHVLRRSRSPAARRQTAARSRPLPRARGRYSW